MTTNSDGHAPPCAASFESDSCTQPEQVSSSPIFIFEHGQIPIATLGEVTRKCYIRSNPRPKHWHRPVASLTFNAVRIWNIILNCCKNYTLLVNFTGEREKQFKNLEKCAIRMDIVYWLMDMDNSMNVNNRIHSFVAHEFLFIIRLTKNSHFVKNIEFQLLSFQTKIV